MDVVQTHSYSIGQEGCQFGKTVTNGEDTKEKDRDNGDFEQTLGFIVAYYPRYTGSNPVGFLSSE